ncbi:hypothetical protein AB1K08_04690 [Staphylococcus aureus]
MEKNESNITDVTQNEEQLDNSDEQSQQNEKTFSQEEVSQLIKYSVVKHISKTSLYNQSQVYKIMKDIKQSITMRNNEAIVDNILKQLYNKTYIKRKDK